MRPLSFSIANFKSFGNMPNEIPLRPITLVFGPNSAGKSSILHSLIWLRHGLLHGNLDVQKPLGGEGLDLGGFDHIVHRHEKERMPLIGWTIPATLIEEGPGGWNRMDRFEINLAFKKTGETVHCSLVSVATPKGEFFRATHRQSGMWEIDLLDWEHPALAAVITAAGGIEPELEESIRKRNPSEYLALALTGLLPDRLTTIAPQGTWLLDKALPQVFRSLFDALRDSLMSGLQKFSYTPPLRQLPPRGFDPLRSDEVWRMIATNDQVRDNMNRWLGDKDRFTPAYRLEILRFLREDTIRDHMPELIRNTVTEWAGRIVEGDLDFMISEALERWRKSPDQVRYARQCPILWQGMVANELDYFENNYETHGLPEWPDLSETEKHEKADQLAEDVFRSDPNYPDDNEPFLLFLADDPEFQSFVSNNLNEQHVAETLLKKTTGNSAEMVLKDLNTNTVVSFQDVGIGISQIIPVVAAALAYQNTTIAVEQPEIHIHPKLQADLGDVIIQSALGENKNCFLLETHSEHLILRILKRIRQTTLGKLPEGMNPVTKDDVAVLFVSPSDEGSIVRELRITDKGKFLDSWPGGFFEESFDEMF
jgi:hypothetical protein